MIIHITSTYLKVSAEHLKKIEEGVKRLELTIVPKDKHELMITGKKENLFTFLYLLSKTYDIELV